MLGKEMLLQQQISGPRVTILQDASAAGVLELIYYCDTGMEFMECYPGIPAHIPMATGVYRVNAPMYSTVTLYEQVNLDRDSLYSWDVIDNTIDAYLHVLVEPRSYIPPTPTVRLRNIA